MKILMISDLHLEGYTVLSDNPKTLRGEFEQIYERMFTPADAVCIAGDIAEYEMLQVNFLKFISEKYSQVYYVFGNHELVVKRIFPPERFKTSEQRIHFVKNAISKCPNIHILDGTVSPDGLVGGTMGMTDLRYKVPNPVKGKKPFNPASYWKNGWHDGRHWNYCSQNIATIFDHEMEKLAAVCEKRPRIVMTHFCPDQIGVAEQYVNDPVSAMFYFNAAKYLEMLDNGTIWLCGHTHSQRDTTWSSPDQSKKVRLLCNPVGHPEERNLFAICRKECVYLLDV